MRRSVQIPASNLYAEAIALTLETGTDAPLATILARYPSRSGIEDSFIRMFNDDVQIA
jgi:hypothetical protein